MNPVSCIKFLDMKLISKPYSYFFLLFLFLIAVSYLFKVNNSKSDNQNITIADSTLQKPMVKLAYGLPADSFEIIKGTIQKNMFFGDILGEFNITGNLLAKIEEAAKGIFDFRKIRAGNSFAVLKPKNAVDTPKYLVYEHSNTEYFIINLTDSITIEKREKEIHVHHKTVSGVISSSLWNAMEEQQINPMVAIELSEIFAWSIDFFGLQKDDAFKIMYDEKFVDSVSVGLGQIHGAWFRHAGKEFIAIPYEQDGKISYFDAEGKSLRKAFLKAPLRFSRISSRFTGSRFHPVLQRYTTHYGVDYAAPSGTPVHTIGDGTVISAGWSGGGGYMVKIRHNSVYSTAYLHLKGFAKGIRAGAYVNQGDLIGYVGSTGLSTGPHLDFRVWKNNAPVNPLKLESPSVEPVKPELMERYLSLKDMITDQLQKIELPRFEDIDNSTLYALGKKCIDCNEY
jgi:murein DD-endopeptidase MepM/ murein hydrolase activator NlpD